MARVCTVGAWKADLGVWTMTERAVGIDLGAKALHIVVLGSSDRRLAVVEAAVVLPEEEDALRALCADAEAIAIDAPSDPSAAVHDDDPEISPKFRPARCGEIALGEQHQCWVPWITPRVVRGIATVDAGGLPNVGGQLDRSAWHRSRCTRAEHSPRWPAAGSRRRRPRSGARERLDMLSRHMALPPYAWMWSHDAIDATVAALVAAWSATDGPVVAACHNHEGADGSAIWVPVRA